MPKSPWSQIRQAPAEILVITRRRVRPIARRIFQYLPEVLASFGVVLVVVATWIIHPIAGLYVTGVAGLVAGVVVALGRRPS